MNTVERSATRAAILARLRAAHPGRPVVTPDVAAYYANRTPPAGESRTERFKRNALGWRAEIIEAPPAGWPQALAGVLDGKQSRRVLCGAHGPLADTLRGLLPARRLMAYDRPLADVKAELFGHVDAGVTTTLAAVAETGSLLLWPTPDEPRTLSLIPPLHIAVLFESTIRETLFDVVREQRWADGLPSNAVMITGPSKTADIQRLLVYGAHGPKELVIVLVRDGAAA
ncbi:MAG: lactate utilization protein C [Solimonas sp.]